MTASLVLFGIATGLLEGAVGPSKSITLKQAGQKAKLLDPGKYLIIVKDRSKSLNFHLSGPGVNKRTAVGGTGTTRWTVTLAPGRYTYRSDKGAVGGSFRVS